jgi:NNP family nitrate/nitrite transporter-like MFS transporter
MTENKGAIRVLILNTLAFTVCFACWMTNGVLITFLIENGVFTWTQSQIGWLIGTPVLTGAITRLPVGILTDKYGGRIVYTVLMLISAIPMFLLSEASSYGHFLLASLGFGLTGASFAVGIAYTSVWFSRKRQGTALGIFGAGNAGAALTSMGAPFLLERLTAGGENIEGWRTMPKLYAVALVVTAVIFFLLTVSKKVDDSHITSFAQRLAPLRHLRVWRFGLYYFLVFGGFVALAQWLIPYYVNVYLMPVTMAGLMASIFTLPSGVIRALGGWISDLWGGRVVMFWVLGICLGCFLLLNVPRMDIESPGKGVMAQRAGVVQNITAEEIVVAEKSYPLRAMPADWLEQRDSGVVVLPTAAFWQEPVVAPGETVRKKQLLAKGVTHIFFQANVWIFTGLVFIVGIMMGIGKAAVYRLIPDYFPNDVGVVGGIVGVMGGLGGFVCPILFGYMLQWTGIWTTSWLFFTILAFICFFWMQWVVRQIVRDQAPKLLREIEHPDARDEHHGWQSGEAS